MIDIVRPLFDDNASAQAAPGSDADGSMCDAGCSACEERWLNAERGIAQMARRLNAAGIPGLDAELRIDQPAVGPGNTQDKKQDPRKYENPVTPPPLDELRRQAANAARSGMMHLRGFIGRYFGDENGLAAKRMLGMADDVLARIDDFMKPTAANQLWPQMRPAPPLSPSELRKARGDGLGKNDTADALSYAVAAGHQAAPAKTSSDDAIVHPLDQFHIAATKLAALRTEIEDRETVPDFVRLAVNETIELLHPLGMAAINQRVVVLPPDTDSLRVATTSAPVPAPVADAATAYDYSVPPPGNEPDAAPLMISCDSTYRPASNGDHNDWCNRTFVARMGDTVVASLNVMGYDNNAFDLARCAVAAWELPSKSWGSQKADDLLALKADPRMVDTATHLSRRLSQASALLAEQVTVSGCAGAREIIKEIGDRLHALGEASSFKADRQQYLDLGNGELYVGDADYWRGVIDSAKRESSGAKEIVTLAKDAKEWRELHEKLTAERDDLRQWVREVLLDTRHWLTGHGDGSIKRNDGIDGIPQDYTRIAYAVREINCALEAFDGSKPRGREGMHIAASAFLFGLGWSWVTPDQMWRPRTDGKTRLFCTQEQLDDAERFRRLAAKVNITSFDFATMIGFMFKRGDLSGEARALPKTLTELADRLT